VAYGLQSQSSEFYEIEALSRFDLLSYCFIGGRMLFERPDGLLRVLVTFFACLALVGCQSEAEKALDRAQQLREQGNLEEAMQVVKGAPKSSEDKDAVRELSALEGELLVEIVDAKVEAGEFEEALQVLEERREESFEPDESETDRTLQKLAAKVLISMWDEGGYVGETIDGAKETWKSPRALRHMIENCIETNRLMGAEVHLSDYGKLFGDTPDGEKIHRELQHQLAQKQYGTKHGTDAYYFRKGMALAEEGRIKSLEQAADQYDKLVETFPKSEHASEAKQKAADIRKNIDKYTTPFCTALRSNDWMEVLTKEGEFLEQLQQYTPLGGEGPAVYLKRIDHRARIAELSEHGNVVLPDMRRAKSGVQSVETKNANESELKVALIYALDIFVMAAKTNSKLQDMSVKQSLWMFMGYLKEGPGIAKEMNELARKAQETCGQEAL
jgi:pentatricopeptide repeat protein